MKRSAKMLFLLVLFLGITAGAVAISVNTVRSFARGKNNRKTALVQQRLDETFSLLETLSRDEYIRSPDVSYLEKAEFLTAKNRNENLGYMMVRILDGEINIYREGIGLASSLASRNYMQRLYTTGKSQVTDAFLAGADGKTINYTVTVGIKENGRVTSALMAAIYGEELASFLHDDDSVNVLVGSQLQYMSGAPKDRFGQEVSQTLESEQTLSRPIENILLDFYENKSGSFWGIGRGIQYFIYSPVRPSDWIVLTEVSALPLIRHILIFYGCAVMALLAAALLTGKSSVKRPGGGENEIRDSADDALLIQD